MSYIHRAYQGIANFATFIRSHPRRDIARGKGTSSKRKRSGEHIPGDEPSVRDVDIEAHPEKRVKRPVVGLVQENTPTIDLAKKSRDRVFEAIYRDIFERIDGRVAGSKDSSLEGELEGAEKKFAEVCSLLLYRRDTRTGIFFLGIQAFHKPYFRLPGEGRHSVSFSRN